MIGGLSLFSPGSIQSYGISRTAEARPQQGVASGGSIPVQPQSTGFGSGGRGTLASGATLLAAQEAGQGQSSRGQSSGNAAASDLSEEQQAQVAELKKIDAKVRAHERAHAAAGGAHAGAPSYTYTRGPDGQMYATGGEVAIDLSAESDPEATLQKAAQVAAAALAPAEPSGQDRAVAAAAAQMRMQALAQIREEKRAEQEAQEAEATEAKAARAEAGGQDGTGQIQTRQAHQQIGRLVGLIA